MGGLVPTVQETKGVEKVQSRKATMENVRGDSEGDGC